VILLVAIGWGVIAGGAVLGLARRVDVTRRARAMATHRPGPVQRRLHRRRTACIIDVGVRVAGAPVRRRRSRRTDDAMLAALPVAVDLVGVAVGAGCTPYRAVGLASEWSPPAIATVLAEIDRTTALGASFDEALRGAGSRAPAVRGLTETLRTSARLGSPAAAALVRLAQEVRADVRRRAEARARTVPVRLLFPLVFCVLPAFALLTVVPVLFDGIRF
jgi:tight adherence protein C